MEYYLFKIDGGLYTIVDGEFISLTEATPTPQLFINRGVTTLDYELIKSTDVVEVLTFTTRPEVVGFTFENTRIWKPQIVKQLFDFDSLNGGVLKIDAVIPTSAKIRILVSKDSGETWDIIDREGIPTTTALGDIGTQGMSVDNVNQLAALAWKTYTTESKKFRLALYIEENSPTEKVKINYIRFSYLQ